MTKPDARSPNKSTARAVTRRQTGGRRQPGASRIAGARGCGAAADGRARRSATRSMRAVAKEFQGQRARAARPRPGPPHRRDGAAPPRRARGGAQQLPRKAAAQAEGRAVAHPAFRRRAAPVPRDAAARRGRPRRRSGARATGMRARYDKLVNALLRRVSREGAAALQSQDAVALNMPAWLLQRWTHAYGAEDGAAHRGRFARRGAARHQRQGCARGVGRAARRPGAADGIGAARGRRPHRGSAGLWRRRLVGAGRGGRAAGAAARAGRRQVGRRSVRGARRQDRAARRSRRRRHRRRPLECAAAAAARQSRAA